MKFPKWAWYVVAIVALLAVVSHVGGVSPLQPCPGSLVYCPGVGCVSGPDKCFAGNVGGPSKVFSKETFDIPKPKPWDAEWAPTDPHMYKEWPGPGVDRREQFTNKGSVPDTTPLFGPSRTQKKCPDGTRTLDTCLMEFPTFTNK